MDMAKSALILDDEEDICYLVAAMLKKHEYNIQIAHTLEDGKNLLDSCQFDIVYLDINLPDGEGFELAEDLKVNGFKGNLYFISAYDGSVEKTKAVSLGASGFIHKPFTKNEILNTIQG